MGTSTILAYRLREGRGPRYTDAILMSPIVPAFDEDGVTISTSSTLPIRQESAGLAGGY
ncbi:MAG: hypothetical protein R3B47_02990 [Bacteroidia bacterium]